MEVGGKTGAPGEGDFRVATILEVPGGQVARRLQFVLCASISDVRVQRDTDILLTEAQRD